MVLLPKESLSLAAFGKYFNKPIEMVYKVSAENAITYQNADYAENAGVEIEARKRVSISFTKPCNR